MCRTRTCCEVSSEGFIDREEPEYRRLRGHLIGDEAVDLTYAQWARLEPLLPAPSRPGRPSKWTKRQLIDESGGGYGSGLPG
ncbi:hypothetical protein GCM10009530_19920 [Microbispora corallina]|uniref:Transposase n=1 Tax=Microbispora corallina TaxID=83302 RepID=A0ABQ4FU68_9ACTN|nr:hypothetical protein Mco01_13480 [Microbispora corallina]